MDINLKSITKENVDTLKPYPTDYCRALVQLQMYKELVDSFYNEEYAKVVCHSLRYPSVRKSLFKNSDEATILHMLDTVNPYIRRHLLHMLIEQCDTYPVATVVGKTILTHLPEHKWANENIPEILSLQPIEDLRQAFCARINPKHAKTPLDLYLHSIDPSNHYSKKSFNKESFTYLSPNHFVCLRVLQKRKSFGSLIVELFITGLKGYSKGNKKYLYFVQQPFSLNLQIFQKVWLHGPNTNSLKSQIRETILQFPYYLTKKFPIPSFLRGSIDFESFFLIRFLSQYKIITKKDIYEIILPNVLQHEMKGEYEKPHFVRDFVIELFLSSSEQMVNLSSFLRTISTTPLDLTPKKSNNSNNSNNSNDSNISNNSNNSNDSNDSNINNINNNKKQMHPLAPLWGFCLQLFSEVLIKNFNDGNIQPFEEFINFYMPYHNYQDCFSMMTAPLTFEEIMQITHKVIRNVIDRKQEIVKESPMKYSEQMHSLLRIFLRQDPFNINAYLQSQESPFFLYFTPEERDEMILQAMCDPLGKKLLSVELTKHILTVPLGMSLLISDLSKMTQAIGRPKGKNIDNYGFLDTSISFQPTLTQNNHENEEYKGKASIFECYLFPLLRHKSFRYVSDAFTLYKAYLIKLASIAVTTKNPELYPLVAGVHYRLLRFIISTNTNRVQQLFIPNLSTLLFHPNIVFCGIHQYDQQNSNTSENSSGSENSDNYRRWVKEMYEKIVGRIPYSHSTSGLLLFEILNVILMNSYSKDNLIPGVEEALNEMAKLIINKLYQEMPPSFEFVSIKNNPVNLSPFNLQVFKSPELLSHVKKLINSRCEVVFSDALLNKIYGELLDPRDWMEIQRIKRRKIESQSNQQFPIPRTYLESLLWLQFDFNLKDQKSSKLFQYPQISPSSLVLLTILDSININKIKDYKGEENMKQISTSSNLTTMLIAFIKNYVLNSTIHINLPLPQLSTNLVKLFDTFSGKSDIQNYDILWENIRNHAFNFTFSTASIIRSLIPQNHYLYRLVDVPLVSKHFSDLSSIKLVFSLIDTVLTWKVRSEEEMKQLKKKKPIIEHYSIQTYLNFDDDSSYRSRILSANAKSHWFIKQPHCPTCGSTFKPKKSKNNRNNSNYRNDLIKTIEKERFKWADSVCSQFYEPLLKLDLTASEDYLDIRKDGKSLIQILTQLYKFFSRSVSKLNNSTTFLASLIRICAEDIMITDPQPSKNVPHPKPNETLFSDENGSVYVPPEIPVQMPRSPYGIPGFNKFKGTKAILAFVGKILLSSSFNFSELNYSIFNEQLCTMFGLQAANLKKRIGDDNHGHFADLLITALLKFTKNSNNFDKSIISIISYAGIAKCSMEAIIQYLFSIPKFEEREIASKQLADIILTNIATSDKKKNKIEYPIETQMKVISIILDHRLVGMPLPNWSISCIEKLSKASKLALDLRRSISACIVAYWKCQALCNIKPDSEEFPRLFKVLENLFTLSKGQMSVTFCQLTRPHYCRHLATQSPLYKDMMPMSSCPRNLVIPHNFGELSMPRRGDWKEKQEAFVAAFVGASLSSKDESTLQLVIQVLTKLGIKGGETAEKIAPFIKKAFNDFNILIPSAILLNFLFNFSIQKVHQNYEGIESGFISLFTKARETLDTLNAQQLKHLWFKDENFNLSGYSPLEKLCTVLGTCLDDALERTKGQDDLEVLKNLSEKILVELEGKEEPVLVFQWFTKLLYKVKISADEHLNRALIMSSSSQPSSTDTITQLLLFLEGENGLKHLANTFNNEERFPPFLYSIFSKLSNSFSIEHLQMIAKWPKELITREANSLLREAINNAVIRIKDTEQKDQLIQLLPKLNKFTLYNNLASPPPSSYIPPQAPTNILYAKQCRFERAMPQAAAQIETCTTSRSTALSDRMMFSNMACKQMKAPVLGAAMSMPMQNHLVQHLASNGRRRYDDIDMDEICEAADECIECDECDECIDDDIDFCAERCKDEEKGMEIDSAVPLEKENAMNLEEEEEEEEEENEDFLHLDMDLL